MPELFHQGYAVVIGAGADLPVTVDDATAVAHLLTDPTRCAYPPSQVRLLTDTQAQRQPILDALDWLATVAAPTATAIVYFSGHGREMPTFALIPHALTPAEQQAMAIEEAIFNQKLKAINAGKLLVLLDCCHAGGQAEAKGAIKSPLPPSLVNELNKSGGRVVIASSRKDEVSWTGNPYSVFTTALLEGLAGCGAFEQDGYARVLDVAVWVGRMVPQRTGDNQHPIIKIRNLQDNFVLAWYANGAKSPAPLPWAATASSSVPPRLLPVPSTSIEAQIASWQRQLANYQKNYLLIEERISQYVQFVDVPLQLLRNQQQIEMRIAELEEKLKQI